MRLTGSKMLFDSLLMLLILCWVSKSKPAPLRGVIPGCIEEAFTDSDLLCGKCVPGHFISHDRQNCLPCPNHCASCADSSGACHACQQGFVLGAGGCVSPSSSRLLPGVISCSPGYFLIEGECRSCSRNCKTCESAKVCSKCFLGYSRKAESITEADRVVCEFQWFLAMLIIILVVVGLTACFAIIRIFFSVNRNNPPHDECEYETSRDTLVGGELQVTKQNPHEKSDSLEQRA